MSEPLSTVCEHCDAKLKLKNPDLEGKKIKCPKCGEAFVVVAAGGSAVAKPAKKKKSEDDLDFLDVDADDYGPPPDDDDIDDDDDQPRRRRSKNSNRKSKSKKKSRKGSGDSAQVVKILAIVLVVVLVLGGGGYGMSLLLKGTGSSDLDWLPTEIQGYAKVKVSSIWGANIVQVFRNGKAGQSLTDEMTKNLGKGPQDLDEVVTAILPGQNTELAVFKARQAFDLAALKSADASLSEASHGSATYLKRGSNALYLPEPKTLVFGPETTIQALITRGKKNPSEAKFGFSRGYRDHVVVAMLEPGKPGTSMNPATTPPFMRGTDVAVPLNFLIRANAGSDVNLSAQVDFKTSQESQASVEKTKSDFEKGKADFAKNKSQMQSMPNPFMKPEQVTKLMNGIEQLMNSVQISQSGTRLNMSASVSGQFINDLSEMAASSPLANPTGLKMLMPTGK